MKLLTMLVLSTFFALNVLAQEPWHPHPGDGKTEEQMLKKNLSFILTHSRSALGLAFIAMSEADQFHHYENLKVIPDLRNRIGEGYFRNFSTFQRKLTEMAHETPNGNVIFDASPKALISTIFYMKQMKEYMDRPIESFEQSFNNIQIADYRKKTQKYHDMAWDVCEGDISRLGLPVDSLPSFLVDAGMGILTGRSCSTAVKRDILEIINPYDNPIANSTGHSALEGTSIYLAKRLIPGQSYRYNILYHNLKKTLKIASIHPSYNLHDALKAHLGISSINVIRLINLANHNHGLEFFVLNALLDLTRDVEVAKKEAIETYKAINHLYKIIRDHDNARKLVSSAREDGLARKYHFWGGTFVTCELMKRGYNKHIAALISEKAGAVYENNTSGRSRTRASQIKRYNDTLLHKLGAKYGKKI